MHNDALVAVLVFLIYELKDARARAVSPADEYLMQMLLNRQARRTRRLARLADALEAKDAETPPATD